MCEHSVLRQGRLKIWTEHSTLILLISKSFEVEPPKFQHFYNYKRNEFSSNLEGVAQKMGQLGPLEAWISRQKHLKLQMGMAGPFFKPHPPNFERIHFSLSYKYAEILVALPQRV